MPRHFELPSDCRGDGYDIAVAHHVDDRPAIEKRPDGSTVRRTKVYACGAFCGYMVTIDEPRKEYPDTVIGRLAQRMAAAWSALGHVQLETQGPRGGSNARHIAGWSRSPSQTHSKAAKMAGIPTLPWWSGSAPTPSTGLPSALLKALSE